MKFTTKNNNYLNITSHKKKKINIYRFITKKKNSYKIYNNSKSNKGFFSYKNVFEIC